jgi:hypothetical protein
MWCLIVRPFLLWKRYTGLRLYRGHGPAATTFGRCDFRAGIDRCPAKSLNSRPVVATRLVRYNLNLWLVGEVGLEPTKA